MAEKKQNKKLVYTVLTNNYESPAKIVKDDGWDYICMTDSDTLKSSQWNVKKLPHWVMELPANKRQRIVKILPHIFFPEYEISLYIDANVGIVSKNKLDTYLDKYLKDSVVAIPSHPQRDCVFAETLVVRKSRKDTSSAAVFQAERYLDEGMPSHWGLWETNIMFRKHNNPECIKLMTKWALELMMGSHRDQLSISYSSYRTGVKISGMPKNTRSDGTFRCNMIHKKASVPKTVPPKAQEVKKKLKSPPKKKEQEATKKKTQEMIAKVKTAPKKKIDAVEKLNSKRKKYSSAHNNIMAFVSE